MKNIRGEKMKMNYYEKFKGIETPCNNPDAQDRKKKIKVLVVDDQGFTRDKMSAYAAEALHGMMDASGLLTAESLEEGVRIALSERPDIIITDKDMPEKDQGNALAKAVKGHYNPFIIGVTGGNPEDFDVEHFDIRLQRYQKKEVYIEAIRSAFNPDIPKLKEFRKVMDDSLDMLLAIDILAQGYIAGSQLRRGINPFDIRLFHTPSEEDMRSIFETSSMGLTPEKAREIVGRLQKNLSDIGAGMDNCLVQNAQRMMSDSTVKQMLGFICDGQSEMITEDMASAYHDIFIGLSKSMADTSNNKEYGGNRQ